MKKAIHRDQKYMVITYTGLTDHEFKNIKTDPTEEEYMFIDAGFKLLYVYYSSKGKRRSMGVYERKSKKPHRPKIEIFNAYER